MSGSPVYVAGKLMGAIAYGWSFAKEPLAGVTPIEAILAERDRPDRPPPDPGSAPAPAGAALAPGEASALVARLEPVSIPLAIAGASDAALAFLGEELSAFGLRPVRAGGAGSTSPSNPVPGSRLPPGSAVGVALVSGDMSTTAMGTLTYTDGKQVFAFGHPMFGIGSVNLPLVQGEIHAIIPSLASSLKMSSPIAEIGAITDDSKTGVIGTLGSRASTVPVVVRVVRQGKAKPLFKVAIARHRRLLPMLATTAIATALSEAVPDITDMIAEITTRLSVRGFPPIELRDQVATHEALAPRVLAMSHGMRALGELLGNPFAPAVIETIDVEARVEYRAGTAEITALAAPGGKVRAGGRLPLTVTLRPYAGAERGETLDIAVPAALAGHAVKIEVAGGAQVKPELARAEDLAGLVANLRVFYPAQSLVVSLSTLDDGVALHGRLLRNLPPSALDTLRPAGQSRQADAFRVVSRTAFPRRVIITGQKSVTVRVRDP
jgi:hypothetical protein